MIFWSLFALRVFCSALAVLLFCQCGSDRVDIASWDGRRANVRCATRGHQASLDGFTVSEFDPSKLLASALIDQARKQRKRSPDEMSRIQSERVGARR